MAIVGKLQCQQWSAARALTLRSFADCRGVRGRLIVLVSFNLVPSSVFSCLTTSNKLAVTTVILLRGKTPTALSGLDRAGSRTGLASA